MQPTISKVFWVFCFLTLVLAPLVVLLIAPLPPGRGFWWDFSMALGFAAMAILGAQFLLTARFRLVSAAFGIDIIYYFHRFLAALGFILILIHYLVIRVDNPLVLEASNPLSAPFHMTSGRIALLLFAVLIGTSIWRKKLRIEYDRWRLGHALMATAAFLLAAVHIEGVGYYIDVPLKRGLWTIFTLSWVLLILYVRLIKPLKLLKLPYRITGVRAECSKIWTLIVKPEAHSGVRFSPGQFAWLTLSESPFHVKEHPFSYSSSAEQSGWVEFTIKEVGDFTRTINESRCGEIVYLDGPYGTLSTDGYESSNGLVFVAGGVGIAPIMSMLRTLADQGDNRSLLLFYGNRCWERVAFREEISTLQNRLNLRIVHVLLEPPENWQGERGFLDQPLLLKYLPHRRNALEYFICGPTAMQKSVEHALHRLEVPLKRVHTELTDLV